MYNYRFTEVDFGQGDIYEEILTHEKKLTQQNLKDFLKAIEKKLIINPQYKTMGKIPLMEITCGSLVEQYGFNYVGYPIETSVEIYASYKK